MKIFKSHSYMGKLLPLAILYLSPLIGQGNGIEGVWRMEEALSYGVKAAIPFLFLTVTPDKSFVSDGVDELPVWLKCEGDKMTIVSGHPSAWQSAVYNATLLDALYQIKDDQLIVVDSRVKNAAPFDPANFVKTPIVWIFGRVSESDQSNLAFSQRTDQQKDLLKSLKGIGVKMQCDSNGFVTELDFSEASFDPKYVTDVGILTQLKTIKIGNPDHESMLPEGLSAPIKNTRRKLVGKDLYFYNSKAGESYHRGRIEMTDLSALGTQERTSHKVFSTVSKGKALGIPAFLLPYREKIYAIHPRFSNKDELPSGIRHSDLKGDVRLGRVIVDHLGFQVREFVGNPGPDWLFQPYPKEKLVHYTGNHLQVVGVGDRKAEAFSNIWIRNGQNWMGQGSPVDWHQVGLNLVTDPNCGMATWSGCPVIDPQTGYLIGITSNFKKESKSLMYDVEPIGELFDVQLPPNRSEGIQSFLGIKEADSGSLQALSGIFPPEVLGYQVGKTLASEFSFNHKNFIYSSGEIPLGRKYLLSQLVVGIAAESIPIGSLEMNGSRVRIDDERVEMFQRFLFRQFGNPDETFRSVGESFPGIGFRWNIGKTKMIWRVYLREARNTLDLSFKATVFLKNPSLSPMEMVDGAQTKKVSDDFFRFLASRNPEPYSIIQDSEESARQLGELLERLKNRINGQ